MQTMEQSRPGIKRTNWEYHILQSTNDIRVEFIYNLDGNGLNNVESDTYPAVGPDRFRIKLSSHPTHNYSYQGSNIIKLQYLYRKFDTTDTRKIISGNEMHVCLHTMMDNIFLANGCSANTPTPDQWHSWNGTSANVSITRIKKIRVAFEINRPQEIDNSVTFFSNTYKDSTLTDFKLTGEDGSTVDVHRVVLAWKSPVISRMLSGVWKESQENSLKIAGSNTSTLAQLKRFLYLQKVPKDNLQFHIELACLYEIEDLKAAAIEKLCSKLTVENSTQALAFARRLKLDTLAETISNYIVENALEFATAVTKNSVLYLTFAEHSPDMQK